MNLFSRSQSGVDNTDALRYDLPDSLRIQIVQLWEKGFGKDVDYHPGPGMAYREINRIPCEEHHLFQLPNITGRDLPLRGFIAEYFLNIEDAKALDVVQVVFSTMEQMLHRQISMLGCLDDPFSLSEYRAAEIIEELNCRLQQHLVGYRYEAGQIETIPQGPAPLPLKERLVAGEPARNLRKIKDMIGGMQVTAIHDPYANTGALDTVLKLADLGVLFSPSLRILGTGKALSSSTEKKSFLGFLSDINAERSSSWSVKVYATGMKPHRRVLVLADKSVVTCGMSLDHIDKDEVLDHEPFDSENATHDCKLFEEQWSKGMPI